MRKWVCWGWSRTDAVEAAGMQDGRLASAWLFLLRYIAPLAIGLILIMGVLAW